MTKVYKIDKAQRLAELQAARKAVDANNSKSGQARAKHQELMDLARFAPAQNTALKLEIAKARANNLKPPSGEILDVELLELEAQEHLQIAQAADAQRNRLYSVQSRAEAAIDATEADILRAYRVHTYQSTSAVGPKGQVKIDGLMELLAADRAVGVTTTSVGSILDKILEAPRGLDAKTEDFATRAIAWNATLEMEAAQ